MLTAFLRRSEVARNAQALHLLDALRRALVTLEAQPGTGSHLGEVRCAAHPAVPASLVATRTLIQLTDASSTLTVMDATHLTSLSAGVLVALAADVLSLPDASRVALIGSGKAGVQALKALRLVRSLERVNLFDADLALSTTQALHLHQSLAVRLSACETVAETLAGAQIVVVTQPTALAPSLLRPGMHLSVAPGLELPLVEGMRCFGDEASGNLPFLGGVVAGTRAGRTSPAELTLFAASAAPVLDLFTAWHVYEGARSDETVTRVDLEH